MPRVTDIGEACTLHLAGRDGHAADTFIFRQAADAPTLVGYIETRDAALAEEIAAKWDRSLTVYKYDLPADKEAVVLASLKPAPGPLSPEMERLCVSLESRLRPVDPSLPDCPRCGTRLVDSGERVGLGAVKFRRLRCPNCGHSHVDLPGFRSRPRWLGAL